jgi:hypothetical protein
MTYLYENKSQPQNYFRISYKAKLGRASVASMLTSDKVAGDASIMNADTPRPLG